MSQAGNLSVYFTETVIPGYCDELIAQTANKEDADIPMSPEDVQTPMVRISVTLILLLHWNYGSHFQ